MKITVFGIISKDKNFIVSLYIYLSFKNKIRYMLILLDIIEKLHIIWCILIYKIENFIQIYYKIIIYIVHLVILPVVNIFLNKI